MAPNESKPNEGATVGQRLDHAIDSTREKITHASSSVKDRIEHGKEVLEEIRHKNLDDVLTSAKEFAKNHPGTTLLGGMAVGFLVGYLIRRRD
jgi:ElaB/YqjD/DUF883 family membrane-anchored ribosome-binding protein